MQQGREALAGEGFDMDAILESVDVLVLDVLDLVDRVAGLESRQA